MVSKVISTGLGVDVMAGRWVLAGIGVLVRESLDVGDVFAIGLYVLVSNAPMIQTMAMSNKPKIHAHALLFFGGGLN
jgi:hypothetical protein